MEITSRSEAKKNGASQYFTNLPCRNGHITYRYTQSGSCSACINRPTEGNPIPNKERDERRAAEFELKLKREERKAQEALLSQQMQETRAERLRLKALELELKSSRRRQSEQAKHNLMNLTKFKTRVFLQDMGRFRQLVHAAALMRDPGIEAHRLWTDSPGTAGDGWTAVFTFACFPEDVDMLVKAGVAMFTATNQLIAGEVIAERDRRMAALDALVDAGDDSWPEGDPR
jgi:hypothetical protein